MNAGKETYLSFDLGATSWRAALGFYDNNSQIQIEEIYREKNIPIIRDDGMFWDIHKIFNGMIKVLSDLGKKNIKIKAIGIDSWSVDYGLLDKNNNLLELPRCYRDSRNNDMLDKLSQYINIDTLFDRTKVLAENITTLCQLLAAKEYTPELLKNAKQLLFIPDLLRYWLCGKAATDFTIATTSQLYNTEKEDWDIELLQQLKLPVNILPEIRRQSGIVGYLTEKIQKKTGLGEIPVISGASHDTAAAFHTVDDRENTVVISTGTWSIIGIFVENLLSADMIDYKRFGYEGNVDGSFRLVHNVPGMYLLEKCIDVWRLHNIDISYDTLIAEARKCDNINSRIDPLWSGFNNPQSMPDAIIEYCHNTLQDAPSTVGEYVRIIFASLADTYAKVINELHQLTGQEFKKLIILGGAARNTLLNELISDTVKLEIIAGYTEAAVVGNIKNIKK